MSINKNFVVRNGFEVSTDLILANADTNRVGVGTTAPEYTLHVNGGIGATNVYSAGIGTFIGGLNVGLGGTVLTSLGSSIGIGTALPEYLVDIRSPVSTGQTALYVQGDVRITGDLSLDDVTLDDAEIQDLTVTDTFIVAGLSTFSSNVFINAGLNVSGISTLGSYVDINNSVDISNDLNVSGISTLGSYVDINNSVDISNNLNVTGISTLATVDINAGEIDVSRIETGDLSVTGVTTLGTVQISSGIITAVSGIVTYYGDGRYLDLSNNTSSGIGIGTTGGVVGYGITFIDFYGAGVSTAFYNSNVGIATIFFEGGGAGTIGIGSTFPVSSSNGDLFFHIDYGRTFVYYDEVVLGIGTDAFWVDAAPFNVGILTSLPNISFNPGTAISPSVFFVGDEQTGFFSPNLGEFTVVSTGSSILNVNSGGINVTGDARISGILTVGSSSLTLNGNTNTINGVTISAGIVTATSFYGDGSNLTGAGATVADDTTTNSTFYPLFTNITSGTVSATKISTTKLSFNPSTGNLTVVDLNSTSDINLKENIKTVENALDTLTQLRGVSFDWKENGKSSYGVIAQEIEEVLPELVGNGEVKSVNYNGIIGVLIEAIKDLKKEIENLKSTK